MPASLRNIVEHPSFRDGLLLGALGLGLLVLLRVVLLKSSKALPFAGVTLVATSVLAVQADGVAVRVGALTIGVLLLGLGGVGCASTPLPLGALMLVPGAVVVAAAVPEGGPGWTRIFVATAVTLGGAGATRLRRWPAADSIGPLLAAVTIAGVYVTVPETGIVVVVLGCAVPFVVAGWPFVRSTLGAIGGPPFVGLVCWLAATEGSARPGAVVGASACVGILWFVPALDVVRRWRAPRRIEVTRDVERALTLVIHCALVLVCARVAGLRDGAGSAAVIVAAATIGAIAAACVVRSEPT